MAGSSKESAKLLAFLTKKIRVNTGKYRGLSNKVVDRFCRQMCSDNYKGTFAADKIPNKLARHSKFVIVVNLGKTGKLQATGQKIPIGHFVTICGMPGQIYYIDSYGLPSVVDTINSFLKLSLIHI